MMQERRVTEAFSELLVDVGKEEFPEGLKYKPGNPSFDSAWKSTLKAPEDANDPGTFTAFIWHEWTSTPSGNNIHRNVVYREGEEQYPVFLDLLADSDNLPLVFHCTHVKDRALASAIVLMTLGVSESQARADYLASNNYRNEQIADRLGI